MYRLVSWFYDEVKGSREECFERIYGRWRDPRDLLVRFLMHVVEPRVQVIRYQRGRGPQPKDSFEAAGPAPA